MTKKNKSKKPLAPTAPGQLSTGPPGKSKVYNKPFIHILLIAVIGILAYSNTFEVPFMFDDKAPNGQIEDNLMIRDLGNFSLALKGHDFGGAEGYIFVPRRFVGYLTFALNYKIHGLSVAGYHIGNIAIHIANALLVYFLVLLTFRTPFLKSHEPPHPSLPLKVGGLGRGVAFFSAALFVSHPIQTEAVTYIVQRFTSLSTMFYLLSVVAFIKARLDYPSHIPLPQRAGARWRKSASHLTFFLFSFISAILALMTKEIAFTLPVIVLLYELIFFRHTVKRSLLLSLIVCVILMISSALVLGMKGNSLGDLLSELSQKTRLQSNISRWDYLMTQTRVITTYVRLLVLPLGQNLDYDYPVSHSFFDPKVVLSSVFLSSLFGLGVYLVIKTKDNVNKEDSGQAGTDSRPLRLLGFGILWFFVTLAVESSIIPIADVILEHRLYLPSIGAFIAMTLFMFIVIARGTPRFFSYASAALLSIVVIFSIATYKRNMVWRNEMTMWEDIVSKSPRKVRALNNLASINIEHDRPEVALDYLKQALAADPNNVNAYRNLAGVYMDLGVYDKALAAYRKLLEVQPNNAQVLSSVATAYIKTGNYDAARDAALKALSINPGLPEAYNNLGAAYRKMGKYADAMKAVSRALRIRPNSAVAHNNLGLTYVEMKQPEEAAEAFKRALELDPSYLEAYSNLGGFYIVQKNYDAAIEVFKKAITVDQNYINAYLNLATAYALKGDRDSALKQYAALNKLSPPNAAQLLRTIRKLESEETREK